VTLQKNFHPIIRQRDKQGGRKGRTLDRRVLHFIHSRSVQILKTVSHFILVPFGSKGRPHKFGNRSEQWPVAQVFPYLLVENEKEYIAMVLFVGRRSIGADALDENPDGVYYVLVSYGINYFYFPGIGEQCPKIKIGVAG
jgi:hypothetical protein